MKAKIKWPSWRPSWRQQMHLTRYWLKNQAESLTAASALAKVNEIMGNDDMYEKETAFIELAQALNAMSGNGGDSFTGYFVATDLIAKRSAYLRFRRGTKFFTKDDYLTNPRMHKIPIPKANGQKPIQTLLENTS